MPALAHLLCHWLVGAYAAWQWRRSPSMGERLFGWPLMLTWAVAGLILVPITTFQARMYPSHAAGYALNPELHPQLFARVGPVTLLLMLANLAALWAGFAVTRHSIISGSRTKQVLSIGLVLAGLLGYLAMLRGHAVMFGSYNALWAQEGTNFSQTPSAWLVPIAYIGAILMVSRAARWAGDRPLP